MAAGSGLLEAAIDALELEDVDGGVLADDLRDLHRLRARLDAQVSRRLSAFDASGEWATTGARSAAGWLVSQCRSGQSAAYRAVKVARQVRAMPAVGSAWQIGALGTEHVEVMARTRRAARADDRFADIEAALVRVGEAGPPEDVERVGRQWRDAVDAERQNMDDAAREQWTSRNLDAARIMDGAVSISGHADAEAGSYILRAIEREYEKQHKKDDPRTPGEQRIDALTSICRYYLDGQLGGSNRPHVLFLTDLATFAGDAVGVCETDDGVRVSPETMRRVACDSFVSSALVDANSAVLDLGRATRTFTPEQYRAILVQYPTCVGLGCAMGSNRCEMHHVDWWEHDGPTDVGNGLPLCGHDHHLVHEQGWRVERDTDTGTVTWFRPDGTFAGTVEPRARPAPIPTNVRDPLRVATMARIGALVRSRAA